ncbi:MAG TPA: glycosyltransferase, partial [Methylococcales bacterium]
MKILFLTSGSVRSNFTYRALSLARELEGLGHETAIVCPRADKYNGFKAEKVSELDGVRVLQPFQFKTKRVEINLLPYIFGALILTLKEKPDLVYIYKPTPASIVGLAAKFLRKTPVILDMDDLGSEVMKIEGHPKFQQKLVEWCEILAGKYSDRIVVASSYLFDKYKKEFPQKSIHLMPNGIDKSWLAPVVASSLTKRIVYMGSVGRKNIVEPLFDALPDIITKHPDTQLLFMADGQYLEYFKDKSRVIGIAQHITFTGWLTMEKARENLLAGDLGYGFMPDDITT